MPYNTGVDDADIERIAAWVVKQALAGTGEADLLRGFCEECRPTCLNLSTAVAAIDTLHPVYEGRAFVWRNDGAEEIVEYGSTAEGEAAATWQKSIFFHLLTTGSDEMRRRIGRGDPTDFETLEELKAEGETDYIGFCPSLWPRQRHWRGRLRVLALDDASSRWVL